MLLSAVFLLCFGVHPEIIQLTSTNFNDKIGSKTIVFVNFFVNWCHHCRDFEPTFRSLDKEVEASDIANHVALASVDSVAEPDLSNKFGVNRYPSLYIFKNGRFSGQQFFGVRKIPQLMDFLRQAYPQILPLKSQQDLGGKKFAIVAVDADVNSPLYKDFSMLHQDYYQKCQFYRLETTQKSDPTTSLQVSFYSDTPFLVRDTYTYRQGELSNFENWIKKRCFPLVEQITFDNAAAITSIGKPLLAVIYSKKNSSLLPKVDQDLNNLKSALAGYIPVYADEQEFGNILIRVNKTTADLPFVVLDDMHHVYYFGPVDVLALSENVTAMLEAHKKGMLVDSFVFPNFYVEVIEINNGHVVHHNVNFNENQADNANPVKNEPLKKDKVLHDHINADPIKKHERAHKEPDSGASKEERKDSKRLESLFKHLMPDRNSFTMAKQDEL